MDLVISANNYPKSGETLIGRDFFTNPGGKGANQAVAASIFGGTVFMGGLVGKDQFGIELKNNLKKYNVKNKYLKSINNISSGIAVITLSEADNRIIIDPGANYKLTYDYVNLFLENASPGDILLTQLEIPIDVVKYGLEYAKSIGMTTILNPAPANQDILSALSNVDILIPNEGELYALANSTDLNTACRNLIKSGVSTLIVTLGEKGAYYFTNKKQIILPTIKVTPIDTTGAGDTFCGAVAAMISKQLNIIDAIKFANKAASLSVLKKGAQQAIPTLNEVKNLK